MKNIGGFDSALSNVGTGVVGSPLCGDVMKLQLFFDDDDIIVDARYKVFGCVSAIAAMEFTTTILKGKTIEEALQIRNEEVADSLELTKIKRHCSVLAKEAIEAAVKDYKAKKNNEENMITITKKAAEKIKKLIEEQNAVGVDILIESSGCSGLNYSLSYEKNADTTDKAKIEVDGISFFYDKEMELMIRGIDIDIVENGISNGFSVTNKYHRPCQNCTCGCR